MEWKTGKVLRKIGKFGKKWNEFLWTQDHNKVNKGCTGEAGAER